MNKFLVGFLIIIAILIVLWAVYTASDTKEEFVEGEQTRREDIETLALYFGNSRKMDLPIDCGWVYPVEREVKEKSERSSLEELLGGPSGEEEKNGYFSAIKKGVHPEDSTKSNIEHAQSQLKSFGNAFDWSNVVTTSSSEYYKWTQWLFLKLYEKGFSTIRFNFSETGESGLKGISIKQQVDNINSLVDRFKSYKKILTGRGNSS